MSTVTDEDVAEVGNMGRFVVSKDVDPKIAEKCVDQNFMLKLPELFDSGDSHGHNYLRMILYGIYWEFMALRSNVKGQAYFQSFFMAGVPLRGGKNEGSPPKNTKNGSSRPHATTTILT